MTMTRGDGSRSRTDRGQSTSLLSGGRRPATRGRGVRTRSRGLVAGAAVLVLGSGLAVAWLVLNAGQKESVVSVQIPATCGCDHLAKGEVIPRDWLTSSSVSGVSGAVPISQINSVAGMTASTDLFSGEILTHNMYSSAQVPGLGQATVGLSLDPSRVPSAGLEPGDLVDVVEVPASNSNSTVGQGALLDSPPVLAHNAEVYSVKGDATQGGSELVTVVVDANVSARISAYSAQGQIAIVETSDAKQPTSSSSSSTSKGQG